MKMEILAVRQQGGWAQGHQWSAEGLRSVSNFADILAVAARTDTSDTVKFFTEQFSVTASVSGKFVVESSLRSSLLVLASTMAQEDIEVFHLTSPRDCVHSPDKDAAYYRLPGLSKAGV